MTLLSGCGGGGSSGGGGGVAFNGGSYESDFFLEDIYFGRPLFDLNGVTTQVVNPISHIQMDPITGLLLPGYPQVLYSGDSLNNLLSLNLVNTSSQPFEPKIVPRNAALIVDFSETVDQASLNLDQDNMLTVDSPIQVTDQLGRAVPIQVTFPAAGDQLVLNPVVGDNVGLPASPISFDENGIPVTNPDGFVLIVFYSMGTGVNVLKSEEDNELGARFDLLGTPLSPIGINPGNRVLDFVEFNDMTFHGFLPDLTPARIIREVSDNGIAGAGSTVTTIVDPGASFNVTANSGDGEWAGALVTVRQGQISEEKVRIATNTATTLFLDTPLATPPAVGVDDYLIQRAEYFEPIPGFSRPETAVDPVNHPKDPDDPEDAFNFDLIFFMKFDRWDGNNWIPVNYDPGNDPGNPIKQIDPTWRLSVQYSESMDLESFLPYETFYVSNDIGEITDPCFNTMKLGRTTGSSRNTIVSFEPFHTDQFGILGGDTFRGFGKEAKDLRFVLRIVPSLKQVQAFYASLPDAPPGYPGGNAGYWYDQWGVVDDLEAEGVLSISDIGGQPLGLPRQFFDKRDPYCLINMSSPGRGAFPPAVDFILKLSCNADPALDEVGTVVHRFMGQPETAADPGTGETGVVYRDHDDLDGTHDDNEIYGPHIADIQLGMSGFLSGHPVEFIEHVFDDYNPPSPSSPSAPDPIYKTPFGAGTPINASFGVRFEHVYRRGDCSPDVPTYQGTILDLVGLAWSPIGGHVTTTDIKEFSIAVALSSLKLDQPYGNPVKYYYDEPNTRESGGIPNGKHTGLWNKKFDERRRKKSELNKPAPGDLITDGHVYDVDGDGFARDEWTIVLGDPIDEAAYSFNEENYYDPGNPTGPSILLSTVQGKPYADGRPYHITQSNIYAPKNQGSGFNYYLPYPDFDNPVEHPGFGYDSTRGMLVEIRTDDNLGLYVSARNGYAFHAAVQSSQLPRFRAYARAYPPPTIPYPGGSSTQRPSVFGASDPYDMLNPPFQQTGSLIQPNDTIAWIHPWDGLLPGDASYGDNSRYFMIFDYGKRVSVIMSPRIRVSPISVTKPEYLSPLIEPSFSEIPPGTNLTIEFRASSDGVGTFETDWFPPDQISQLNTGIYPFVQFRAVFEANMATGDLPVIDTIVIPFIDKSP